jgi:outer membrane protein OmpA-like peptidoglycan-associated protein
MENPTIARIVPRTHDRAADFRAVARRAVLGGLILLAVVGAWRSSARADAPPDTVIAASDAQTQFTLDGTHWTPAVATWVHPSWPSLKNATWIWTVDKVSSHEAAHGSPIITFRRTFRYDGPADAHATLMITADNAYQATLNGKALGSNGALDPTSNADAQWHSFDSYDVALKPGTNELVVKAINYHWPYGGSATPEQNPAGLVFSLTQPPLIAKTLAETGTARIYGIYFDVDKSDIKSGSKATLDEIAGVLKADPTLTLEVSGHTDNSGTNAHNLILSRNRAVAVVNALVRDYGIVSSRLRAQGYGDTRPVESNDTDAGKAKNRRVELKKL